MKNIIKRIICCMLCIIAFVYVNKYRVLALDIDKDTLKFDISEFTEVWNNSMCRKHVIITGKANPFTVRLISTCVYECEVLDLSDLEIDVIPHESFIDNKKLRKVMLPKKLKKIESVCFSGCYNLETVVLPDGLREIGQGSFMACPKLKLEVPSSVKCGEDVFDRSPGVTIVEVESDPLCGCCSWLLDWISIGNKCDEKKNV